MHLAVSWLKEEGVSLAELANRLGYQSEAASSRATRGDVYSYTTTRAGTARPRWVPDSGITRWEPSLGSHQMGP